MAVPQFCEARDVERLTNRKYDAGSNPTLNDVKKHCVAANDDLDALLRLYGIEHIEATTFTEAAYPQAWRICSEIAANDAAGVCEAITLGASSDFVRSSVIDRTKAKYNEKTKLVKEKGLPGYLPESEDSSSPQLTGGQDEPLFTLDEKF